MKKIIIDLPEIKLVGITAKTNNNDEMDPAKAKIGATLQQYFGQHLAAKIKNKKNSGTVFCVYTWYESDSTGNYTYFVGEEVNSFEEIPEDFAEITIPYQNYVKFTNNPGQMPLVCIDMWQNIWKMEDEDLGGKRSYVADFEIYDQRSLDPQNTVLDIYIGIR